MMTRLWLPMGRRVLLLIAFLVALALLLPMRLAFGWFALDAHGIGARAVHGSLWGGVIEEMHVGALPLGTLDAALSPLPLLLGRARLDLTRHDGDELSGAITVSRNSIGIDDLTASLATGGVLAPLPIAGIDFEDVSVRFVGGSCERAEGRVRARLAGAIPGIALAQGLTGTVACDGTRARVSLASQSGRERIELSIDAAGNYIADALIAEPDPVLAPALVKFGFARVPGGYRLRTTGGVE
jgi:general secretion pathway protein N